MVTFHRFEPLSFRIVLLVLLVGCSGGLGLTHQVLHMNYTISGQIYKEYGSARYTRLACFSDSGLIGHAQTDLENGAYRIELSAIEAQQLRYFRITDGESTVTEFRFDRHHLKDSIICINFYLRTLPKQFEVKMSVVSHGEPSVLYDTLWLDLNGRHVDKAFSDSVWRRVPLRDRRRR